MEVMERLHFRKGQYLVLYSSIYSWTTCFVDGNTLSAFSNIVSELIIILEKESLIIVDWFQDNEMVINPGKFQALIIDRKR